MKILIVTPHFYPENFRINDFAKYFVDKSCDVSVLTAIPNYPAGKFFKGYGLFKKKYEEYENIKIHRAIVFPRLSGKPIMLVLNYISYLIFSVVKIFQLRKNNYDLVFVFQVSPITVAFPALFYKFLNNKPVVMWVLDLWPESIKVGLNLKTNYFPKLINPIIKFIYRKTDSILVSSKGFVNSISEKKIDITKIKYMPQWSETIFRYIEVKKETFSFLDINDFVVLFAGNIGEAQDFITIIKSIKILQNKKNIKWVFVGNGRKKQWLSNKIKDEGLKNIFLLDSMPLSSMPNLYSMADCLLISLKNDQNLNLTIPAKFQSYLSSGMPVLGMIGGQVSEIIKEAKCGEVAKPGNEEELASITLKMSSMSKKEINEMKKNSYKYYLDNFQRKKVLKNFYNHFLEIIN